MGIVPPSIRKRAERAPWHGAAFMVEALAILLFLAASLAVLMLLFSLSYNRGMQADRLSNSVLLATNNAESFAANPQEADQLQYFEEISNVMQEAAFSGEEPTDLYKVERNVSSSPEARGLHYYATISVSYNDELVYQVETSRYVGSQEVAENE